MESATRYAAARKTKKKKKKKETKSKVEDEEEEKEDDAFLDECRFIHDYAIFDACNEVLESREGKKAAKQIQRLTQYGVEGESEMGRDEKQKYMVEREKEAIVGFLRAQVGRWDQMEEDPRGTREMVYVLNGR